MARFVLRVWLPDKPGALGRVASAIGSVGASLVGIDILEQDGGWAIDELIVEAVDATNAAEKITAALTFVEEVNVEDIRLMPGRVIDPRVDALQTAAELMEQSSAQGVREALVRSVHEDMQASWVAVIGFADEEPLMASGELPNIAWIKAFLAGSRSSGAAVRGDHGPEDIAWAELSLTESALILGREGRPFRERERKQLAALVMVADRRLADLTR